VIRILCFVSNAVAAVFLVAVVSLLALEATWVTPEPRSPRDYFLYGSTGTELMPLPVFQVLADLFPDQFQPAGKSAGDWIDQFGFVRGEPGVNEGLPVGINVSHYRPLSGAPTPVAFVGFNCAVCHTGQILRSENDRGFGFVGMANPRVDLVAFGDAVKTSILDERRLTPASISSTYQSKYGRTLNLSEKLMITLWLQGARAELQADMPLRGRPFGGADLRDAALLASGPGRNQPMRETVRFLIHQTPFPDGGAAKIPSLYHADRRAWGQFDGSLHGPLTRNALAALGVGASVYNLRVPGILGTMGNSYSFISKLDGPRYADVFRGYARPVNADSAKRGRAVYANSCLACHGAPGPQGEWTPGKRQGEVISAQQLGTDQARVTFRFYPQMADLIYAFFPEGHPLRPRRSDLRPNAGDVHGYIAQPIESVFSRAPFLHNGSVVTLAELINLKPRRPVFYRGANLYDPVDVGLLARDRPDARRYFRYDTRAYGNSNRGHDYPWTYKGRGWDRKQLTDLLEYLKTL
jgi:hypothetical protein